MYFEHKGYCLIVEQKYIFEKLETLKDLNQNRNKLINFKEKNGKKTFRPRSSTSNKRINRKIIKCLDLK